MKETGLILRGPLVQAVLSGRKTQHRMLVKPQPRVVGDGIPYGGVELIGLPKCPYGGLGDRLWVKETYRLFDSHSECACYDDCRCSRFNGKPIYRADQTGFVEGVKWKPSTQMPRWASRIIREIVSVRVERLQDISAQDCIAEGIQIPRCGCEVCATQSEICTADAGELIMAYKALWESINGPGSWELNPWVWVIEFNEVEA